MSSLMAKTFSRVNSVPHRRVVPLLAVSLWLAATFCVTACTVFSDSQGNETLAGRNWDMTEAALGVPVMWAVPAQNPTHGRICFGRHGDCEDGMNDQGLFVAVAASPPNGSFKSRQEPVSCPWALDQLLAHCANVDEAIAWWEKRRNPIINCSVNRRAFLGIKSAYKNSGVGGHILMGDKHGNSVVCEWEKGKLKVMRKTGRYQLITNFLLSKPDLTGSLCPRFAAATKILNEAEQPSSATCLAALKATSRELTRYSVVYDLARGDAHVYCNGHFEKGVPLHLSEELKMGAHEVKLETLFSASKD
jgi:hypothetical protein